MSRRIQSLPPGTRLVLVVEGADERRALEPLLPANAFIWAAGGRDVAAALRDLTFQPAWPDVRAVGVIVDAEEDPAASASLGAEALAVVGWPRPTGEGIAVDGERRGGVLVVPGDGRAGAIEAWLWAWAPPERRACVEAYFACTPNPGRTEAQRQKACVEVLAAGFEPTFRRDDLWDLVPVDDPCRDPARQFVAALRGR